MQRPASSLYLGTICNLFGNKNALSRRSASFIGKKAKRFVEEMPMTVTGKAQKFVMRERMIEELKLNETKTA